MREDNKHQKPNLVDDIVAIRYLLRYLKKYDLWYATGHEIAKYWKTYQGTDVFADGSRVEVTAKPEILGKTLWIAVSGEDMTCERLCLKSEAGEVIDGQRFQNGFLFEIKLTKEREFFYLITL